MRIKLKQKAGHLEIQDFIHDQEGYRKTKQFLSDLISGVCYNAHLYWRACKDSKNIDLDHQLRHSERSMYSLFAASLAGITPLHLSEVPVSRKWYGQDAKNGRIDFWALHRERSFLLELKRARIAISTPWNAETLDKIFHKVDAQTKSLKKEAKSWSAFGAGELSRISLQVVLPYQTKLGTSETNKTIFDSDKALTHSSQLLELTGGKYSSPNFCAIWTPPTEMTVFDYQRKTGGARTEWNPYIGFVAKILLKT